MNNIYWKEKYADYHSRAESKIAEIEKENKKLKEALEEIRRIMRDIIKDNGRHNLSEYSSPIRIEKIVNEVLKDE